MEENEKLVIERIVNHYNLGENNERYQELIKKFNLPDKKDKTYSFCKGLRYNGINYYFNDEVPTYNISDLFKAIHSGKKLPFAAEKSYEQFRNALIKINYDRQNQTLGTAKDLFVLMNDGDIKFKTIASEDILNQNQEIEPEVEQDQIIEEKPYKNLKLSNKAKKWIAGGLTALALVAGHLIMVKNQKGNIFNSNSIGTNIDKETKEIQSKMLKSSSEFVASFNQNADTETNDEDFKLQITADEARAYWLFVNHESFTEEQIAQIFGQESYIVNPSKAIELVTNVAKQVYNYEHLTGKNVNMTSLIYNNSQKDVYKKFQSTLRSAKQIQKDGLWNEYLVSSEGKLRTNNAAECSAYIDYLEDIGSISKTVETKLQDIYNCEFSEFKNKLESTQFILLSEGIKNVLPESKQLSLEEEQLRNNDINHSKVYVAPHDRITVVDKKETNQTVTEQHTKSWTTTNQTPSNKLEQDAYDKAQIDEKNEIEQNKANNIQEKHDDAVKDIIDDGVNKDGLYDIPTNTPETVKDVIENVNDQIEKDPAQTTTEKTEEYISQEELDAMAAIGAIADETSSVRVR